MRLYFQYSLVGISYKLYPILSIPNPKKQLSEDEILLYTRNTFWYEDLKFDKTKWEEISKSSSIQDYIQSQMNLNGVNIHFQQQSAEDIIQILQQFNIEVRQIEGIGLLTGGLKALTQWETGWQRLAIDQIEELKKNNIEFKIEEDQIIQINKLSQYLSPIKELVIDLYGSIHKDENERFLLQQLSVFLSEKIESLILTIYLPSSGTDELLQSLFSEFQQRYTKYLKNLKTLEIHFCFWSKITKKENVFEFLKELSSGGNLKRINFNLGLSGEGEFFNPNQNNVEILKQICKMNQNLIHFLIHLPNSANYKSNKQLMQFGQFFSNDFSVMENKIRVLSIDVWNSVYCGKKHQDFIEQLISCFQKRDVEYQSLNINLENWKCIYQNKFNIPKKIISLLASIKGARNFFFNMRMIIIDSDQAYEIINQIKRMNSNVLMNSFVIYMQRDTAKDLSSANILFQYRNNSYEQMINNYKALMNSTLSNQFRHDIIKDMQRICYQQTEQQLDAFVSGYIKKKKKNPNLNYQFTTY